MSTSRSPALSGPSKKISSWVRPGVCEVRASALRPVSALIRLDLPTLERPANATSMPAIGGSVSIEGEAQTNFHSPAKSFRPSSISFASVSAVMRRFSPARHCERSEAIQWIGLRSLDCFVASPPCANASRLSQAMTRRGSSRLLDGLLGRERRLDVVEQLHLHAVLAHDVALLQHRKQVVPGPVDHETCGEASQHEGEDQRHP